MMVGGGFAVGILSLSLESPPAPPPPLSNQFQGVRRLSRRPVFPTNPPSNMNLKQLSHYLDLFIMLLLWWLVSLLSSCHHSAKQCTVQSTDATSLVDSRWWQTVDSMGLRVFVFDYDTESLALATITDSNLPTIPGLPTKPTHARQYLIEGARTKTHHLRDTTKKVSQISSTTVTTPVNPPSTLVPGRGGLLAIGFFAGAVAIIILVRTRGH